MLSPSLGNNALWLASIRNIPAKGVTTDIPIYRTINIDSINGVIINGQIEVVKSFKSGMGTPKPYVCTNKGALDN